MSEQETNSLALPIEFYSWWRDPSQSEDAHCLKEIEYAGDERRTFKAACGRRFEPRIASMSDSYRCAECKYAIEMERRESAARWEAMLTYEEF